MLGVIESQKLKSEVDDLRFTEKQEMVRPAGVEPTTLGFGNRYSIHLSYGRILRRRSS